MISIVRDFSSAAFCAILLLAAAPCRADTATPAAVALPPIKADSLGGDRVSLPADAKGAPIVLIISYDRKGEEPLKTWSHAILAKVGTHARVYAVVEAAGAPFFVHGMIKSGVAHDAPDSQPEHKSNILITFDDSGWRTFAPPGTKEDVAVVVVDAHGAIVFSERVPFSTDGVDAAAKALGL